VSEIRCIKADHKYSVVVVGDEREYLSDLPLSSFLESYPELLLQIHRNTLVNRQRLTELHHTADHGWQLSIDGLDSSLPVSRRQLAALKLALKTADN